ncbi:MAG TPA: MFS transporter [Kineosporiaceae bacterium]
MRPGDLRRLRAGQTVSMFGDEVTAVALPTVALLTLHATPLQFGLLTAATYLPYPLLGLQVGAWVDRMRRRRVMVMADVVRFTAIASIPLAAFAGALTITHLFVVGLVVGTASLYFNAAYQAYLPSIVDADQITIANVKLSVSETGAQVGGPPLAGLLIGALGAAGALAVDAASFLVSVASLRFIRRAEPGPARDRERRTSPAPPRRVRRRPRRQRGALRREIREGLQVVFTDPLIRGLTLTSALSNLGRGMCLELFLLFAYDGLRLTPGTASLVLAVGNLGSLAGSLTSGRVTAALGLGPALRIGSLLKGLPWVLAPLTLLAPPVPVSMAMILVSSYFVPISNVTTVSIRQSLVSRELQGRVASTTRTVTRTMVPLSAVLGGVLANVSTAALGQRAGLAVVLAVGGLLWTSATVLLPRRRLERLRTLSDVHRAEPTVPAAPALPSPRGDGTRQPLEDGTRQPRRDRTRLGRGAPPRRAGADTRPAEDPKPSPYLNPWPDTRPSPYAQPATPSP